MRKIFSFVDLFRRRSALEAHLFPDSVLPVFLDFEYHHYALGDLLTKQVEAACHAIKSGCNEVDLYVGVDPNRPAAPTQGFITTENYVFHLDNLAAAMLCQPMLRSLNFVRDSGLTLNFLRKSAARQKHPMWPSFRSQLDRQVHYPLGHSAINKHFFEHGSIPMLSSPRGYEQWADRFLKKHFLDKFVVVINPRQSRLTATPATTYRDADVSVWNAFLRRAGQEFPKVHFIRVGGYSELDTEGLALPNVTATRALGLDLAHELALLVRADMFIGTSSGFATMATFSDLPYMICNIEPYFAKYAEVSVGENYPFAQPGQSLYWPKEDAEMMFAYLDRELDRIRIFGQTRRARNVPGGEHFAEI